MTILRSGSKGSAVKRMQELLIAAGYSCGPYGADGVFGSATRAALLSFQLDHGLEVDGEYGPLSRAALSAQNPNDKAESGEPLVCGQNYMLSVGTHYISNNGADENGSYSGGAAGDQTGREWQLRPWYAYPWNCVLRHPDQLIAQKIAELSIQAALNDSIGYDQGQRESYWNCLKAAGYDPSKIAVPCEADCSAGVCANVRAAGYLLGNKALQEHKATYTGNMREAFRKAGFVVLTEGKYLTSPDHLLPGDILLNDRNHTAVSCTVGSQVRGVWRPVAVEKKTFPCYNLTPIQLLHIARLCQQEQGTVAGAMAEASLMANQLEGSPSRREKYGTGAPGLYNWVRNGGWFDKAAYWMENGACSDEVFEGVRDVLCDGKRTLPSFIDEHDCLPDIVSVSTGLPRDKTAYIRGKTVVTNVYGSTWTFWCFPDGQSDPFGYTSRPDSITASNEREQDRVEVSITDLRIRTGPGVDHSWTGEYAEPGVHYITETRAGTGSTAGWGKLENGAGWISLDYASRS